MISDFQITENRPHIAVDEVNQDESTVQSWSVDLNPSSRDEGPVEEIWTGFRNGKGIRQGKIARPKDSGPNLVIL